jgi:hypothetical protein
MQVSKVFWTFLYFPEIKANDRILLLFAELATLRGIQINTINPETGERKAE